ncbi:hypothetical protein BgiBS90_025001 [Biomphalaria glabrata]|nr:hypothetical protein BgiBS90_025001 [Biomphalaria glabrata]
MSPSLVSLRYEPITCLTTQGFHHLSHYAMSPSLVSLRYDPNYLSHYAMIPSLVSLRYEPITCLTTI